MRDSIFWLQPTAHSLLHLLGDCHILTPGSARSGVVAPLSYQSSISRNEIECVVGSAISPAASCARVNQRASSSSSSLRSMSVRLARAVKPSISEDGNGHGCDE